MLLVPVESTDISAAGYDPVLGQLQIGFVKGGIYQYENVPPEVYQGFLDAPSKGQYFAQNIRKFPGMYPATRIL